MSGLHDPHGLLGRALTLDGSLACLCTSKSLLRGQPSRSQVESAAGRATQYEDWLELNNPASALLPELRQVRRRLEELVGRKYNRPTGD